MTMGGLRALLAGERPSFGCWINIGGSVIGDMMGRAGFDWALCDLQHGALDFSTLLPTLHALEAGGTGGLVRVGGNDPIQIGRALDLGAVGVVVPMVSTVTQAREAVRAMRYPPEGERSFGPVRSAYASAAGPREEPLCLAMIETAEAMNNLDAIAAVPGLDGLFVGPVDLALSLGLGAQLVMSDAVLAAVEQVVAVCNQHDITPGCAPLGMENARVLAQKGVRFLPVGGDGGYIRRGAAADVALARSWPVASEAG